METTFRALSRHIGLKELIIDSAAILLIYFMPSLSHVSQLPLYSVEPMRLILVVALVHSSRPNAYILALTLPIFSYLISSHPSLLKMGLITIELVTNVYLFGLFRNLIRNGFVSILLSIVLSKTIYYLLKFSALTFALLEGSLVSTPFSIQIIITLVFSIYGGFILSRTSEKIGSHHN